MLFITLKFQVNTLQTYFYRNLSLQNFLNHLQIKQSCRKQNPGKRKKILGLSRNTKSPIPHSSSEERSNNSGTYLVFE